MNTGEKLRLAVQLENLGIDVLEAGFPAASEGDFESSRTFADWGHDGHVRALV